MGWNQFFRSVAAAQRRSVRLAQARERQHARETRQHTNAVVRSMREQAREQARQERYAKEQAKQAARDDAERQASEYEEYLDHLVSLHEECGDRWNWEAIALAPAPQAPERQQTLEVGATAALNAYVPGFFKRLFVKDKKTRSLPAGSVPSGSHPAALYAQPSS